MVKIKRIKEIDILSSTFKVVWAKSFDGGNFSLRNSEITIGIKSLNIDPLYTFHIISHELMEIIFVMIGARYENGREEKFLFSFDHQTFETAIQIHAQALAKFIVWG